MERVYLKMVREKMEGYEARTRVATPTDAYQVLKDIMGDLPYESVQAIFTDNKSNVVGITEIGRGSIKGSVVCPRELITPALMCNAVNIIMAHNHPSGELEPSKQDIEVTKELVKACKTVAINFVDHLILPSCGEEGEYTSIRNESPGIFKGHA